MSHSNSNSQIPSNIHLKSHPTARDQACAANYTFAGTIVLQVEALATALLPSEKGQRCDNCMRRPETGTRLAKCTGCAEYWYCGTTCQNIQWQQHHRRICKRYNSFLASSKYQELNPTDRVDSILLSHLTNVVFHDHEFKPPSSGLSGPIPAFFDLMKGPAVTRRNLPLCRTGRTNDLPNNIVEEMYLRFGNNNFLVHSHLNSCAHGIFPLASRLFNHSCDPNCVAKYQFISGKSVMMDIVAIRNIEAGEEITLPYLDPALPFQTRQEALSMNYGFTCTCALCTFQRGINPLGPLPPPEELVKLESDLGEFASSKILPLEAREGFDFSNTGGARWNLPKHIHPLLNADYMPSLSEEFSRASHEGEYAKALSSGKTLLSLYSVLYPLTYPQIGMHALELTKTAWNAVVTHEQGHGSGTALGTEYENTARHYLAIASVILDLLGPEGDPGGPLEELQVMRSSLYV
ncbi:hypothetical protein BDW22DRAFT_1324583 [Trametopsis cervina]|nr:hypothetical protein BDW22DRAFT_1324583 [Trametopsis cervina]